MRFKLTAFILILISCLVAVEIKAENANYFPHIAEITQKKCNHCHQDGSLSFPLDTYEALYNFRLPASNAVYSRRMPPWLAAPGFQEYEQDFSLTEEEISLWRSWEKNGFKKGDSSKQTHVEKPSIKKPAPDLEIYTVDPNSPYKPDKTKNDEYQCFISEWPHHQTVYITDLEYENPQPSIVHHAIFSVIKPQLAPYFRRSLNKHFNQTNVSRYKCYSNLIPDYLLEDRRKIIWDIDTQKLLRRINKFSHFLGGWIPRYSGGDRLNEMTGEKILPGSLIISQLHLSNIQSSDEAIKGGVLKFRIKDKVDYPGATLIISHKNWFSKPKINKLAIPPNQAFSVNMKRSLPTIFSKVHNIVDQNQKFSALRINGGLLHMHGFGESGEVKIIDETKDTEITLLKIPKWDQNWQLVYSLKEPIELEKSELKNKYIELTCNYFNTTSETVYGGFASNQEMCQFYGNFSLVPIE